MFPRPRPAHAFDEGCACALNPVCVLMKFDTVFYITVIRLPFVYTVQLLTCYSSQLHLRTAQHVKCYDFDRILIARNCGTITLTSNSLFDFGQAHKLCRLAD